MAAMRPLKTLALLGFTPILQVSACRASPVLSQPQCSLYSTEASSIDPLAFRIAASYSAKDYRLNPKMNLFSFNPNHKPVPKRVLGRYRPMSGQDSFFINNVGNSTEDVAFGVADGVGGWSDSGIDSALLSHGLCESMAQTARNTAESPSTKLRARQLLQKGYDAVVADPSIRGGGTTACVALGRSDGSLEVANLGDSGFVQLRPAAVRYASTPQTHAFNTPYQLSVIPPEMLARARAFGGAPLHDYPSDASVTSHRVAHGDVLVFATDGVWDNLSPADVLKLVNRYMTSFDGWTTEGEGGARAADGLEALTVEGGIVPQKHGENTMQALLAVAITGEAKMASVNSKMDGPFAREVKRLYPGEDFRGGKVDDICVVVAVVVRRKDE